MKYYKYQHEEHNFGQGILTAFYEVDDLNEIIRSIEIRPDGGKSRYDIQNLDDDYGGLPEADFDYKLAGDFGKIQEITQTLFEEEWK